MAVWCYSNFKLIIQGDIALKEVLAFPIARHVRYDTKATLHIFGTRRIHHHFSLFIWKSEPDPYPSHCFLCKTFNTLACLKLTSPFLKEGEMDGVGFDNVRWVPLSSAVSLVGTLFSFKFLIYIGGMPRKTSRGHIKRAARFQHQKRPEVL